MQWCDANNKTRRPLYFTIAGLRFLFLFPFFLFLSGYLKSSPTLSEGAEMSILTCGPGKPLYAMFGHTALWVHDPENNIDEVYNFGTFDVNTPDFYLKFLTGRLDYALSQSSYVNFLKEYTAENRWVCRQEVNLPVETVQKIYDSLTIVYRPENRFYRYDFFKKNCATRVFDLLLAFAGDRQMIDSLRQPSGITFRDGLKTYIGGREWISLGINFLLGPFADQQISRLQSTFLPDFLMIEAEKTGIAGFPVIITNGSYTLPEPSIPDIPMIIFWGILIFLVIEALWLKTLKKTTNLIDVLLFGLSGLLGFLLLFFWFWSDHVSLHVNLNLIWALPLNLLVVWALWNDKEKFARIYLLFYGLLQFFLLINWNRLPQQFPIVLMPLVTLLAFRAVNRVFRFREKDEAIEISDQ